MGLTFFFFITHYLVHITDSSAMKVSLKGTREDCLGCDQRTLTRMLRCVNEIALGDPGTILGPLIHQPDGDNWSQIKDGVPSDSNEEFMLRFDAALSPCPSW